MTRQLNVRLPDNLWTRLTWAAKRAGRKRSDIVRLALERFLSGPAVHTQSRPVDFVRDLLGSVESGLPDLGEGHREHLVRRLRRTR